MGGPWEISDRGGGEGGSIYKEMNEWAKWVQYWKLEGNDK